MRLYFDAQGLRKCAARIGGWAATALGADTPQEPRGDLTLSVAVEAALARNPDLAASGYEIRAADARVLQSGLRLNPSSLPISRTSVGTGAARGVDMAELTLSLSQVVELGGKRDLASGSRGCRSGCRRDHAARGAVGRAGRSHAPLHCHGCRSGAR